MLLQWDSPTRHIVKPYLWLMLKMCSCRKAGSHVLPVEFMQVSDVPHLINVDSRVLGDLFHMSDGLESDVAMPMSVIFHLPFEQVLHARAHYFTVDFATDQGVLQV